MQEEMANAKLTTPVSPPGTLNPKWDSFAAKADMSLTSPAAPRRKCNATKENPKVQSFTEGSPNISGLTDFHTSYSSFSSFAANTLSPNPTPKKPQRKKSGDKLDGMRNSTLPNAKPLFPNHDDDSGYVGLNDEEGDNGAAQKAGRKIKRVQRPGILSAFSDSELSEASTIDSRGSKYSKSAIKRQTIQQRRQARKMKSMESTPGNVEEDDDVIDTDKDLEGLTGLAISKFKEDLKGKETTTTPSNPSRHDVLARSRGRSWKGNSSEETESRKHRKKKKREDRLQRRLSCSATKTRSNRRKLKSSDEETSSDDEITNDRRARSKSGERRSKGKAKGERSSSATSGRRRGRKSEATRKGGRRPRSCDLDRFFSSDVPAYFDSEEPTDNPTFSPSTVLSPGDTYRSKVTFVSGLTEPSVVSEVSLGFEDDSSEESEQEAPKIIQKDALTALAPSLADNETEAQSKLDMNPSIPRRKKSSELMHNPYKQHGIITDIQSDVESSDESE